MQTQMKLCLFVVYLTLSCAQYDPYAQRPSGQNDPNDRYNQGQYDRDRNDRDRDRQYDRDRPGQYDRDRYDQNDRDRYGQNDRNRTDQFGRQNPYDRDRYGRPGSDRDRYDTADGVNGTDRYDVNRSRSDPYGQYDSRRPYDGQQRPYDGQQRPYDGQQRPYDGQQRPYDGQQRPYDRRDRYGSTGERIDDTNCCQDYCFLNDREQYLKFGTKTAYEFARSKASSDQHNIPQCRPVLMWSLNKPGTTLPDQRTMERLMRLDTIHQDIVHNYDVENSYPTRGRLCQEDYNLLKRWQWNRTLAFNMADMLSSQGKEDLRLLARRYQSRFSDLLHVPYSSNYYYFKYSNSDRTYDSYQAYIEGLFTNNAFNVHAEVAFDDQFGGSRSCKNSYGGYGQNTYPNSDSNNYQSSYPNDPYNQNQQTSYQNPSYQNPGYQNPQTNYQNPQTNYQNPQTNYQNPQTNYQNPQTNYQNPQTNNQYPQTNYQNPQTSYQSGLNDVFVQEYTMFKDKIEYRDMVKNVLRRLGFKYTMNDTIIEDMYNMCRYEKAWYNNDASAWCAAFTKRQLELLEYGEDLKEYYTTGYGKEEENRRIGCSIVRDMYDRFQRRVSGVTTEPKVAVTFTGSSMFQRFLVAMGIAKDYSPLTALNSFSQSGRKWRTSEISPFSGNLVAILYECDSNQRDSHKVMFYLNEKPVDFPECSVGLCSWETLRSKYQDLIDTCSVDLCNSAPSKTTSFYLIALVAFLLNKCRL